MDEHQQLLPIAVVGCHHLLSKDFIERELVGRADWLTPELVAEADGKLHDFWTKRVPRLKELKEENLRDELLDPIFQDVLRYSTRREGPIPSSRSVDYALFANDVCKAEANVKDPWPSAESLCEAKRWGRVLDKRYPQDYEDPYNPTTQVAGYGRRTGQPYVILSNGGEWRLLWQGERHTYEPFIRFDLDVVMNLPEAEERLPWVRVFLALFGHQSLTRRPDGRRPIDDWRERVEEQGVTIAGKLDDQVYRAVDHLLEAFQQNPPVPDYDLEHGFNDALILVYRILFVLHAEARGLLPMERDSEYRERVSLGHQIRTVVLDPTNEPSKQMHTLWGHLNDLFRIIDQGSEKFGVFRYNGGLLSDEKHPNLARLRLNDDVMTRVLTYIGAAEVDEDGRKVWMQVDYRLIPVQQLGRIYEGLLERGPTVNSAGRWETGRDHIKRKKSGSYYTPDELVRLIVERTLEPLVDERFEKRDETPEAAAEEVLNLTVLDPACGSGHFLIGAVDYLAERLQELEIPPPTPGDDGGDEDDLTAWRRLVTERCIYGVDINPLAVELTKLSLWLHTLAQNRALTFLDHHIRIGNSLVGCWLNQLDKRPVWTPQGKRTGRYDQEMEFALDQSEYQEAVKQMLSISKRPTVNAEDVKRKEKDFEKVLKGMRHLREALDLRLGALFLPVPPGEYYAFLGDGVVRSDAIREALKKAKDLTAFHWEVEFPEVFNLDFPAARRGFHAVIANPPWERVKLQEIEFFSTRDEDIANAPTKAKRRKLIEALETTRPELYRLYENALEAAYEQSDFFHNSGIYPLGGVGDVNYYTVFAERFVQLIKAEGGRTGFLCPSGIATDFSIRFYFQELVKHDKLRALYDFENRHIFFPDVHYQFKFAVMIVGDRIEGEEPGVDYCAFIHDVKALGDTERRFRIHPDDFRRFNPNTFTAPILRRRSDLELLKRIYATAPVLIEKDEEGNEINNRWGVSFLRMFDMTNDSHLFKTARELEAEGCYRDAGRFGYYKKGEEYWLPLYEGKMIWHYDHRFADLMQGGERIQNTQATNYLTDEEKSNPKKVAEPRFWVNERVVADVNGGKLPSWWLGFRDITNATNARTSISAASPCVACGNKHPIVLSENESLFLVIANLNSTPLDYAIRNKLQGTTLNFYIIEQFPIFPPERYDQPLNAADDQSLAERLKPLVLELVYTAWDMEPFARELGFDGPPFTWDPERRAHLKARIDAAYMLLYGMSIEDADYILETFPIVKRQDEKAYGFYRTKELIKGYMRALSAGDWETVVEV